MVAPIASAASSLGRAIARRGARKNRSSPQRRRAHAASACHALPQLGHWPTPAEVSKSLLVSKLVDDGRGSEQLRAPSLGLSPVISAFPLDWRSAEAKVFACAEVSQNGSTSVDSEVDISSGDTVRSACGHDGVDMVHADRPTAAVMSFLSADSEANGDCADAMLGSRDDSGLPVDEDRHAAAVRAFLDRVMKPNKSGCGDTVKFRDAHHSRHVSSISRRGDRWALAGGEKGRVRFDLRLNSVHEVTPYMEIYGRHPREFVFGRCDEMLPAGDRFGFVGLQEEGDEAQEACLDEEAAADGEGIRG